MKTKKISKKKKIGLLLISLGVISVLASGWLWLRNSMEENEAASVSENIAQELLEIIEVSNNIQEGGSSASGGVENPSGLPDEEILGDDLAEGLRYVMVNGTAYIGVLSMPELGLDLPVNSAWSYPALRHTPCRFSGTIEGNDLVLMAHSYRSHFGGISDLPMGSLIILTDVEGVQHIYEVVHREIVDPSRTYFVMHSGYDLTLFTCTYTGQARVVVRAMRLDDNVELVYE